jgi:hypothetical protein
MWGSLMGHRYDVPISEMIAMFEGKPADIDGAWSIVNKTFVHTGGEPPASN